MENYESYFRLFKTSWGILIGFSGNIKEDIIDADVNLIKINHSLTLKLNIPEQNKYIHSNKTLIENGILWVYDNIPNKKNIIVEINQIDLNFCNFQLEGLFFGVANWLCNYYNINMPNYYSSMIRI